MRIRSLVFAITLLLGMGMAAAKGTVEWPTEWVVFAPFERGDTFIDGAIPTEIPENLVLQSESGAALEPVAGQPIEVATGVPASLRRFFEQQQIGNAAYVFLEVESPQAQTVMLGMGADWWMRGWLNGELIIDTLSHGRGNDIGPIAITNHAIEVDLRKGSNLLVLHLVTGRSSSQLAVGGPRELARALKARASDPNVRSESFEERAVFPQDTQALVTANKGLRLPQTDADLAAGAIAGIEPMPSRQMFAGESARATHTMTEDRVDPRFEEPVRLLLSKYRYPWEDRHLDAIVWTTSEAEGAPLEGILEVLLKDNSGTVLARHEIRDLSPSGLFFSVGFPPEMEGSEGELEVVWRDDNRVVGSAQSAFHVDAPAAVARHGRIPLRILNEPGATLDNAPMTVGVPFPHGALQDADNVRLIDEQGNEQPLQTLVTGRWSRYGPVKWLLCDFTVDLRGEPKQMYLEFGPAVQRASFPPINVVQTAGFPNLDAGRLRVESGELLADPDGQGVFHSVLARGALAGAFVTHEDGRLFTVPTDGDYRVEEIGTSKAVIRRTGWYVDANSGDRFCQYVTRIAFYRNSPVVRIFHTWIFTGNGNVDRIADMGWHFQTPEQPQQGRILSSFAPANWLATPALVQFNYADYLLPESAHEVEGRAAGVLSLGQADTRVTFGTKDFWQNFPSELEIDDAGFTFYNWPRHNPPARFERPVAPADAFRLRFAHEGEMLDFRLPFEYTEDAIWGEATGGGRRLELHWMREQPESANAQGIARTEEMFLYLSNESESLDRVVPVMQGLNDETIRAVADPDWVIGTGVFGPVHAYDPQRFADEERAYELVVKSPARWVERLGFYGMWVHGDYPTWRLNLDERTVSNYRTLRKGHHDYPLKWLPYARSGDPELLKLAENATRQMTDANFNHYATAEIDAAVGPDHYRTQGWWDRSLLPWAGRTDTTTRGYAVDSDYMWQAWYLTGYQRARDVALLFGELTQHDFRRTGAGRDPQTVLASYIDMYQATFDPWFLNASHEMARMHRLRYGDEVYDDHPSLLDDPRGAAHRREDWRMADQKFYRFTRSAEHEAVARNSAVSTAGDRWSVTRASYQGEGGAGSDIADLAAEAWYRTGDPYYLGRLAAELDYLKYAVYDGEVDYFKGFLPGRGHGFSVPEVADGVPYAMAVLAQLESQPEPIHNPLGIPGEWIDRDNPEVMKLTLPDVYVQHRDEGPLLLMFHSRGQGQSDFDCIFQYQIDGPGGFEMAGEGVAPDTLELQVDAGEYRIQLEGRIHYPQPDADRGWLLRRGGLWYYPLTPYDVPEVFHFSGDENGTPVPAGRCWFFVPEGTAEFWIEFGSGIRSGTRPSVWNPDGERAWDRARTREESRNAPAERVTITVPPGQSGKLWRVTGASFTIDPAIPPYFSFSRSKWFDPRKAP